MRHQIKLQDRFKQSNLDQDKILPPEETVQRFKDKTRAAGLSILDETTRIDNGRLDIPVFFSCLRP